MAIWAAVAVETVIYEVIADAPEGASTAEVEKLLQKAHVIGESRRAHSFTNIMVTGRIGEPPRIPASPMPPDVPELDD